MPDFNYLNLLDSSRGNIDEYIAQIKTKKKLILYFHGGLSTEKYVAENLGPYLMDTLFTDEIFNRDEVLPIFMIYETGIFDFKKQFKPFSKKFFIKILKDFLLSKIIAVEEKVKSKSNKNNWDEEEEVKEMFNESIYYAKNHIKNDFITYAKSANKKSRINLWNLLKKGFKKLYFLLKNTNFLVDVFLGLAIRYTNKTNHKPIVTIIEELLKTKYTSFLHSYAKNHWNGVYKNAEKIWENNNKGFLKKLIQLKMDRENTDNPLQIELISHSAGSIAITYLVQKIDLLIKDSNLNYPIINNILMVAPAVRLKMFQENVLISKSYNNLRVYNLTEECEEKDKIAGGVYPSSLLYFVSSIAEEEKVIGETTILGMHRFFKKEKPYTNRRYNNYGVYGHINDCIASFTNDVNKKLILITDDINYRGQNDDDYIYTQGASHSETKTPDSSSELAIDLISYLNEKPFDKEKIINKWNEVSKNYNFKED